MRMLKRRFPSLGLFAFYWKGYFTEVFQTPSIIETSNKRRARNKILRLVNGVCKDCLRSRLRRWLPLSGVIALYLSESRKFSVKGLVSSLYMANYNSLKNKHF